MSYESSPIGNEVSAEFYGIDPRILTNHSFLKRSLREALEIDNFQILDFSEYEFNPQGYTLAILISESHAAIHTYPEYESLTFHLYSCRRKGDGINAYEHFHSKMNPSRVNFQERPIIINPNFLTK